MYWKYLKYILNHKWYVLQECWKMDIFWRGLLHDLSKFRPSEFIPYANYFYGDYLEPDIKIRPAFDKAWLLHIHRNPHHWQYWLLQEDDGSLRVLDMPEKYLKEMVCDWIGAGISITGSNNILEWYSENKSHIIMSKSTKFKLEQLIA